MKYDLFSYKFGLNIFTGEISSSLLLYKLNKKATKESKKGKNMNIWYKIKRLSTMRFKRSHRKELWNGQYSNQLINLNALTQTVFAFLCCLIWYYGVPDIALEREALAWFVPSHVEEVELVLARDVEVLLRSSRKWLKVFINTKIKYY